MTSTINEMPRPAVAVKLRAPHQPAPITIPAAASSSSAWISAYLRCFVDGSTRKVSQYSLNASMSDVDGVIGYQAPTVAPAKTAPSAAAELPSIRMLSDVAFIRSKRKGNGQSQVDFAES